MATPILWLNHVKSSEHLHVSCEKSWTPHPDRVQRHLQQPALPLSADDFQARLGAGLVDPWEDEMHQMGGSMNGRYPKWLVYNRKSH